MKHLRLVATKMAWAGVVLVLMVAVCVVGYSMTSTTAAERVSALEAELVDIDARNSALEATNTRLRNRVDSVRHDPRMIEKLAREEYNLVNPGSIVYLFPSR